jgi:hypothetical protein
MNIKLREITAKAVFYEKLFMIQRVIAEGHGDYASPCVDEGIDYIKSNIFSSNYIKDKVYKLLDRAYHDYLNMLYQEVRRRITGEDGVCSDESLRFLFEQNRHWLAYDEKSCDWYDAAALNFVGKEKSENRLHGLLRKERIACEKRLAIQKTLEKERSRENNEKRLQMILLKQRQQGFWSCMTDVGLS